MLGFRIRSTRTGSTFFVVQFIRQPIPAAVTRTQFTLLVCVVFTVGLAMLPTALGLRVV